MDCNLPGSSVHGILQARILGWVAMPSSRGFSWPRDRTLVSCISSIGIQVLYQYSATWEAHIGWHLIIHFLKESSEMFLAISNLHSFFCMDPANGQIYVGIIKRGSESVSHIIFYCQSSFLQNTYIGYFNITESKKKCSVQFSCSVMSDSVTPWIAACQASLSITNSRSLLKLMPIESVMPSSHLILCCPLLLLPPIPPSIRVFPNESTLRMRWPKYWSFSFSISPSNEHPGLISFRMDWLNITNFPFHVWSSWH